jgi:hypothetical protein
VASKKKHLHQGQHGKDPLLIAALAAGESPAEAASSAKVSLRTVRRRMADPQFKAALAKARDDMLERTLGVLAKGSIRASIALTKLLSDPDGKLRLGAAKALLGVGLGVRTDVDLTRRIEEIKQQLAARDKEPAEPSMPPFTGNKHA